MNRETLPLRLQNSVDICVAFLMSKSGVMQVDPELGQSNPLILSSVKAIAHQLLSASPELPH
jgi:hypothetical protein